MTSILRWASDLGDPPRLLVVGGASLDVLHVQGRPVPSAGGAGLYTSLAAARAGAAVTMLAPRPEPMPEPLAPAGRWIDWVGPIVPPDDLPRFEIAYGSDGDVTQFKSEAGAEPDLRPDLLDGLADLPGMAFCVPFLDVDLQLAFVDDLRRRGVITAANTYVWAARERKETVLRTARHSDVFFCNEAEATLLFGSVEAVTCEPGRLVYVTRGRHGAVVVQGDLQTEVPAVVAEALDPTGAGDTFCGTVLAQLAAGAHPVEAARAGVAAAAAEVAAIGPQRLLDPSDLPNPPADPRARVETARVTALAALIAGLDEAEAFPFTGPVFPEPGAPGALDFFFSATLQQFGFWTTSNGHYHLPTYATVEGTRHKGSDYLWAGYLRRMRSGPAALQPAGQASWDAAELAAVMQDDDGRNLLPMLDEHAGLAAAYGSTMTGMGVLPGELIAAANESSRPLAALLRMLDHVGGYREDPLRKKAALLAIILRQRPEQWLRPQEGDDSPPIVDYHVQRSCLRTGMVVPDDGLRARLVERAVIEPAEEGAIRRAAYAAVARLVEISGRSMGAVDWFLFSMRHRCPEMSEPRCEVCPAEPACAREVDLFQPVLRTTAY